MALVLGLFAVYIANVYLTGKQEQAALGGTTKVAVASVPLAYGTDITPDKVRFVDYPNSSIPPGVFVNAAQLKQRVALLPIGVNEPILASKISGTGQGASIAALLPDGMRAASVRINDVSGVAGFVQPNDSVDVLITRQVAGGTGAGQQVTDILLQNVRVIAIDQTAKNDDGSPKVAHTATLEVNPLDAQKLALAQEAGTLSLVLRKPGEQNNPVVETVSLNDLRYNLYGGARYPAPAVVGSFGGGLDGAISGAMMRTAAQINAPHAHATVRTATTHVVIRKHSPAAPPPETSRSVEVYRGTASNSYKVGE
ncbi:Flp pilus assembly protein CpaB [Sphingomonas sp.]|uniref:Flp pilus assembly protein CpaB n=1 Tax=Sphingomonas sp. TaxID=28214 RepID=UPI0025EC424D|nr:Flp pilus assembly protein CpaB [Sphingomonas sp.]MBV9527434.1 Flp pilus assembly protein CpaB [Sphingomonas sp.]